MTLLHQFASHAAGSPDRIALECGDRRYTYGELWHAASALAAQLVARGVGRNDRVCLLADKSFELYAAIWATWLAGAAYVTLAPSYPAARLRLIVERAKPKLLWFTSPEAWERIADGLMVPAERITIGGGTFDRARVDVAHPSDLAYVLFTSGSTGMPKGVMVTQGNVAAFVGWAQEFFSVTSNDRFSGHSDLTFDLSVFDTFVAHCSGACLVPVIETFDRTTPGSFVRRNNITMWFSVPSVLSAMIALGDAPADKLASLRWMAFCGEAMLPGPTRQLMLSSPHVRVANLYGPTEATVACAAHALVKAPEPEDDAVPFGWHTGGTEIFVWTDEGRAAAIGETGEVFIAGDQVGAGYFEDADETARRFVADPRGGAARCFKTGDIATVRPDGPVFKMRVDNQVKFRGWRIELGDIERALAGVPGIVECAAAVIRRDGKADALAAFVRSAQPITAPAVLKQLRVHLPEYMIPTHVRPVVDFPRTLNDKIDRSRLAELL